MKYALYQWQESNFVAEAYGGENYEGPILTRQIFRLVSEFDTLDEAVKMRDSYDNPEWFKIIQVW